MQYNQQNPQPIFYIRPRTPKLKNTWLTILLKIVLIASIFFSLVFDNISSYNSLFFYIINTGTSDYLAVGGMSVTELMQSFDTSTMAIVYKYFAPIVMSLIFFVLYIVYAKMFAYLVFNQFLVLGLKFNIKKFRICLDSSFIFLTLVLGIANLIFAYYPLAYNLGYVFVSIFAVLATMALFFVTFSRGVDKKYYPILFYIMTIPTISLLLFV